MPISRSTFDPTRTRRAGGLVLLALAVAAVAGAVALMAYPAGTDIRYHRLQARLTTQLRTPELRSDYQARAIRAGDSLTRMSIPRLGVDTVVVEGTSSSALRAGAGHFPGTPLPGEGGNVAVAGHRTTYGHPFRDLDQLRPGDEIRFQTPVGTHTYMVSRAPFVVANSDWRITEATPTATLTLSTCHPKGSARQRLVVRADLVS